MKTNQRMLLMLDAGINLALGILLLFFPLGIAEWLGVPETNTSFYPSILGAVIFGIGIALLIELYAEPYGFRGLGLGGAIAINFAGAGVLLLWLLFVPFEIPMRGHLLLWSIAITVLLVALAELVAKSWR